MSNSAFLYRAIHSPRGHVHAWLEEATGEADFISYSYTKLYVRIHGEDTVAFSSNRDIKEVCEKLRSAGIPISGYAGT